MKEYKDIKYEISEGILTITISRPERYNAYTDNLCQELIDAFGEGDRDDNVRVIILTGDPKGKHFCAGMDLGNAGSTFDITKTPLMEHRDSGGVLALAIFDCNKPVIAAINGSAVGVGFTMTLPCDFRIASNRGKYGAVFVRRGVVPDGCSSYFLPRIVGMSNAMKIALTGKVWKADELDKMGLYYKVVDPEDVMKEALELARDIATNCAPVSCAMTRRLLWSMQGAQSPMDAHEVESLLYWYLGAAPDAAEGVNSFLEKRDPKYSMSPTKDLPPCYPWQPKRTFRNK
ncbi:MAG: enoyl-CoA hydratase/isomerase family protein [Clostridia bacterium]|nr:enoyl-CoA hydratase/isomerase family protein [Clostridia bacterium]